MALQIRTRIAHDWKVVGLNLTTSSDATIEPLSETLNPPLHQGYWTLVDPSPYSYLYIVGVFHGE